MRSAEIIKAGERADMAALLSIGIAAASSALVTEGAGIILYILLGTVIITAALLGLHKKFLAYLHGIGWPRLTIFLALFFPLSGLLIFTIYPLAIGFAASAGVPLKSRIILLSIISGLLAFSNLVVLIINIFSLLRGRQTDH